MKRLFKNGRTSPLLYGLSFLVAMLFCTGEVSAQFKASLQDSYTLNLKDAMEGKTPKPKQDAIVALTAEAATYRNGYAGQQGTDNEVLHLLRINYFLSLASTIDNGMGISDALTKELDATLLAEAKDYGPVVTALALETIYREAVALVTF